MFKIYVNYLDRTTYIPIKSISMNDSISVKSDSLSFTMHIEEMQIDPPRAGQLVEVRYYFDTYPTEYVTAAYGKQPIYSAQYDLYYDETEVKWYVYEFKGTIQTVTRKWAGQPRWLEYVCNCCDFTRQLDRNLVNEVYPSGWYAGDIVADIISTYTTGFTTRNRYQGFRVPEMTFDFVEPSSCIQQLAEAIGFQWYVDFNKDIHFYWRENAQSPLSTTTSNNVLNIDTEIVNAYNLELTEDMSQLKNQILVKNAKFKGSYTNEDFVKAQDKFYKIFYKVFPFDSSTTQAERADKFVVKIYDVDGSGNFTESSRQITTIKLDEVEGQVGDGSGDNNTIYINFGSGVANCGIRFPDNYPLGTGQVVRVYYYKVEEVPLLEVDQASIDSLKLREGGDSSGIYEYSYDASSIYTEKGEEVTAAVDRVLLRYKDPLWVGQFQSRLRGWKAGQVFTLFGYRWGETRGGGNPINEICWVKDVSKTILKDDMMEYTVSFSSSPFGD